MIQRIATVLRGNLIAWLALFVARGGTSLAASHYVINSTKQISPSLLKKLQGRVGKSGPQGAISPQGPKGAMGLNGSEGAPGAIGPSDGIVHYVTGPAALFASTRRPYRPCRSQELGATSSGPRPISVQLPVRTPPYARSMRKATLTNRRRWRRIRSRRKRSP